MLKKEKNKKLTSILIILLCGIIFVGIILGLINLAGNIEFETGETQSSILDQLTNQTNITQPVSGTNTLIKIINQTNEKKSSGGGGSSGNSEEVECTKDSECIDNNPCNIDKCLDNECRHGKLYDPASIEGCCSVNKDCNDNDVGTIDICKEDDQCKNTQKAAADALKCGHSEDCDQNLVCIDGSCVIGTKCTQHSECDDKKSYTIDYCLDNVCRYIMEECTFIDTDNGINFTKPGTCTDNAISKSDYCKDDSSVLYEYYLSDGGGCFSGCKLITYNCTNLGEDWYCDNDDGFCAYNNPWNSNLNCVDKNHNGICDIDQACVDRCKTIPGKDYNFGDCAVYNPNSAASKSGVCYLISGTYESTLESKCAGENEICCCMSLQIQ